MDLTKNVIIGIAILAVVIFIGQILANSIGKKLDVVGGK